jgi:hypothetical protein
MTSLRASATIMVLRVPIRLSAVRARYHTASARRSLLYDEPRESHAAV